MQGSRHSSLPHEKKKLTYSKTTILFFQLNSESGEFAKGYVFIEEVAYNQLEISLEIELVLLSSLPVELTLGNLYIYGHGTWSKVTLTCDFTYIYNALAREMAQQIGTLSALSENQVHFSGPTKQLTTFSNSGSEGSNNHFSTRWVPNTHRCNGYIQLKDSHKTDTSKSVGLWGHRYSWDIFTNLQSKKHIRLS